jgi:hypothetical protein
MLLHGILGNEFGMVTAGNNTTTKPESDQKYILFTVFNISRSDQK